MAIDVFQKNWSAVPTITSKANQQHPLCPRHGFIVNDGKIVDIVRGFVASQGSGPGSWRGNSVRGYAGRAREHTATADFDNLGPTAVLLPAQNATFVLGYQKTDGTNRASAAVGTNAAVPNAGEVDFLVPFSDGTVYFDFGGNAGANRVSVAGLTFGDDIWTFTVGPREMAIYQNAVVKVSAAQNPSRTDQADTLTFGKLGANASDLALWKFFFIYFRQLQVQEISEITAHPFIWVDPRS